MLNYSDNNTIKHFLLYIMALHLLLESFCQASTFYLDNNVGDDNYSTIQAQNQLTPWKTLDKVKSIAQDGDTVIVSNGFYGAYTESNIDRTDWIYYKAANGHTPEISHILIDNQGRSYSTFLSYQGFKIAPLPDRRAAVEIRNTSNFVIKDCEIIGQGCENTIFGFYSWGSSGNILIDNNIFSGGGKIGRFSGFGNGIYATTTNNVEIANNEIKQVSGYGLFIPCGDYLIKNNNVHNIGGDIVGIGFGEGPLIFEGNQFHDLYLYEPVLLEDPATTTWSSDGMTMYNPTASWGFDEPINWANMVEIWIESGNNVLLGDQEFRVAEVVSPTEIHLSKSIKADPDGPAPTNVVYKIISVTHADVIQLFAGGETSNIVFRGNQLYDFEGQCIWGNPIYTGSEDNRGGKNIIFENNLCWNDYKDGQAEYMGVVNLSNINGLSIRNNTIIGRLNIGNCGNAKLHSNIISYLSLPSTVLESNDYNIICRGYFDGDNMPGPNSDFLFPGYSWEKWNDSSFTSIFTDYHNGDFSYASADSLAFKHGDRNESVKTDINGNMRKSEPDAGCYEYGACPDGSYALIFNIDGSGSVSLSPDKPFFNQGEIVTITAIPASGYGFSSYSGDITGGDATTVITMNSHKNASVHFIDIKAPKISKGVAKGNNKVVIVYDEPVEIASATNINNYQITDLDISNVEMQNSLSEVVLSTSDHDKGKNYTLTVKNVKDESNNTMQQASLIYQYDVNASKILYLTCDNNIDDKSVYKENVEWIGTSSYSSGKKINSLSLDGSNAVKIVNTTFLEKCQYISVSLWSKKEPETGYSVLVSKHPGITIIIQETSIKIDLQTDGGRSLRTINNLLIDDTEWHHYGMVYDGNFVSVYLDGVVIDTSSLTGNLIESSNAFLIGMDPWGKNFSGKIDEISIYDIPLTNEEMLDLYNSPPPQVVDLQVDAADDTSLPIQWGTNEAATAKISYWPKAASKSGGVSTETAKSNADKTEHTITLTGLSPDTEYSYSITCTDEFGNTETYEDAAYTFTTLAHINTKPVAGDDTLTASEDVAKVSGDLTANDSDVDNDTLTISGVSGCTKGGTVTINSDKKSVTYTTAKDYDGTNGGPDSFTYTVSDGHGGTDTATVTVNITPVNDNPVATDSTLTLDEDSTAVSGDLTANGSDVDGDGLAVSGVTNASHGTVKSNGDGTVTYEPSANYYGSDSFDFTLSDGNGGTATGTVNVTVRPVNDGPVAVNDSITLSEDTDKTVSLVTNDTDADNDTLSISSVTQGENGSVINNGNGTVTYSPLPNFIGPDSFTYTVSDGNGKTASATVNVLVTQVNDEPVATSDSIVTNEDTAKTSGNLLANDTDGDNDTLTITSVTQGGHGSVVNNGNGTVTYTPAANYHGDDSFTYTISDSKGGSDTATVAVTVTSVNDKPVAGNDTIAVNEDIAKVSGNLLANDSDVDGDTISVSAVSQGAHGTVINVGNGTVTYTPAANYNGSDSFTYTVSDGKGGTATGTVNVLIAAVNDKPEPTADILNVTEDTDATSGNLLTNDTDAEGDTLTITSVSQGSHGRVSSNNDGTVTYRPASNYNGLDTFTYTVSDNHGGTAIGTVNVVVAAVPDEPVITASSTLSVAALGTLNFQVSANDLDGDTVKFSFEGVPDGADFVDNGGGKATFNWTPAKDQAKSYSMKVIATDDSEAALSVSKTIVISVSDADNNIPVFAEIGDKNATEMSQLSFTISATDADGDSLTYKCEPGFSNASFNANTRTFTWTPDYDQGRDDPYTVEFTADDSFNGVATATVKIYVANKNRKPEFTSFSVPGFVEDTENTFTISATDPDGYSITYSGVNLPEGAILNENSGVFSWKPGYEDAGNKSVTFRATDSNNEYTDKTVSLTVANTNRDPEFTDSTYSSYSATAENKLKFTVYTSDPDGDAVTVKWNGKPSGAAFDTNTNAFAWIPKAGTQGSYEAVFTAKDSNGATVSKTITIAVDLGNQPPVFNQVTVPEFTETDTVMVTVGATDPDGDSLVYSMSGHPADATIDRNSGQIRWQTGYDDAGVYTIVVKASDGEHEVDKEISVTVNNLNRKPAVTVSGNTSPAYVDGLKLTVSTSDEDGDTVTVTVSNLPGGAAFDKNAGIISWAPKQTDIGQHNIVVTANDGVDDTIKTVAVTINQDPDYVPNKPPVFVNVSKKQVNEGDQVTFAVEASDPEGDKVQISASNLPSGAVFANNTFSWQTTSEDAGEYSVIFIATDGKSSASMTVLLAVENVNAAPTGLVEGPTKIVAGQLLSLTVSATDPDGDAISYALDKAPKTMGIDGNVISWQTNAKDGGNIYKFSVIVSDDKGASVSIPVVLTVSEAALDSEPPQMVSTYPKKGSVQIPLNPLITFTLSDIDAGVDYESISITVDGTEVFAGSSMSSVSEDAENVMYSSQDSQVVRTGNPTRYTFQYQAVDMFDYDYTPEVIIRAADMQGNEMEPYRFTFTTEMFSMTAPIPVEDSDSKSGSDAFSQSEPEVSVSANGTVWSVWTEGKAGNKTIKFAPYYDNTGQFDSARSISGDGEMAEPDLATAANGDLYMVWQNNVAGNWDICVGRSSNGMSMDMTATVSTSQEEQTNPAIAVAANGDIYVAYETKRKTGKDIFVAKVSSDLVSVIETVVCSNNAEQVNPVIVSGADGDIHIAWEDFRDGSCSVYAASMKNGWQNYKLASNASEPDIIVDTSCDYLHTVWNSNDDIYYSKIPLPLDGRTVNAANVIDDSTGSVQSSPSVYHFNNGKVNRTLVAWTDTRNAISNNDNDIYFASVDRGSMTNVLATIDTELNSQSAPAIATNASGAPYIVFQEQDGKNQSIQMACASVIERMLGKNLIRANEGGYVGVRIEDIDSVDDVTVIVPADAISGDVEMSIARVSNPPGGAGIRSLFSYDFGPSSTREFRKAVNIVIPYPATVGGANVSVFWYNPQTGTYSQSGMSEIEVIDINSELKAISFKTTHFSQYSVSAEFVPWMVSSGEADD